MVHHSTVTYRRAIGVCFISFVTIEPVTHCNFTAIDRAQQIVASMDQQRHQQDKLLATIFDQSSPTSTVHPIESRSTKRGQVLTEDDKEGIVELLSLIYGVRKWSFRTCMEAAGSEGKIS